MKACSICSVTTRVSSATFPEETQAAYGLALNKATYSQTLVVSKHKANKRLMTTERKLKLKPKWGPKNTPTITDYCHRRRERQ